MHLPLLIIVWSIAVAVVLTVLTGILVIVSEIIDG